MNDETHFCTCHHAQDKHVEDGKGTCTIGGCTCPAFKRDTDRDRRLGDRASLGDILYGVKFRHDAHKQTVESKKLSEGDKQLVFADLQKDELELYRKLALVRLRMKEYDEYVERLKTWEREAIATIGLIEGTKLDVF